MEGRNRWTYKKRMRIRRRRRKKRKIKMRMIIKQEDDSKQMAKKWSGRQAEEGTRGERQGGTKVEDD